ncbi:hypothetical protein [Streptomyces sp. 1222.2]|uniref:hypothetical protein n=1 Tax=Streptomyces sp. 1222.2 TaxID=1938833 RepID=UPI00118005AA|nr:hypothetical protein [Streptomyces sp. 1222.2]
MLVSFDTGKLRSASSPGPPVTGSAPGGSVPSASMELGVSGQEVVGERIDDAAQDLDGLPAATIG